MRKLNSGNRNEKSRRASLAARPAGLRKTLRDNAKAPSVYHNVGQPYYITTPQGRRMAGKIRTEHGRVQFEKHVIESKHLHRLFDAWGIDVQVLDSLRAEGVTGIRIVTDTGMVYTCTISAYQAHGIRQDFGYGPQVFLPRKHFTRHPLGQGALFGEEVLG